MSKQASCFIHGTKSFTACLWELFFWHIWTYWCIVFFFKKLPHTRFICDSVGKVPLFPHWFTWVPSADPYFTVIILPTASYLFLMLNIPWAFYSSVLHHGIHLGPVVCCIWSLSGWNLRPRTFPWVHHVLHLPCSTMLWSPNRSRCYWVHICKYLPW